MNPPIAVGVVGCGYWGPNLARAFNSLSDARLIALCDNSDQRLASMQGIYSQATSFKSYHDMLEQAPLEAVVISTPLHTHHALAKSALLSGLHVLVEKPMASTVLECEELIEIAMEKGLTLMVGHTYLYSGAVAKIIEIVNSGDLGEISYINCQRLNLGLLQQDINVAWDLAPHDLSIILQVMGESPISVNCKGNAHVSNGVEDVINMSLDFSWNRFATIQNSWIEPRKVRQMTFVGTKKMIVYNDLEPLEKIKIYDVRVDRPPHYNDFTEFQYSYHYGDCHIPRLDQCEPLLAMAQHFVDSIRNRHAPASCGTKGLEVVRILEATDRSLQADGAPVGLTPTVSTPKTPSDVKLGKGVRLHGISNLYGCSIGDETRIGPFVEIQRGARIGAKCKISSHSFICEGVTLEDEVFIGHGVMFTNDLRPKATNALGLPVEAGEWECRPTIVKSGASIGSGSTLLGGIIIGENAVVGAGSVVTKDVPPNSTVAGNPARPTHPLHAQVTHHA